MDVLSVFVAGPYNVALTVAIVVGFALAFRDGRRAGHDSLAWSVLLVAVATGGLIGSKYISFDFQAPAFGAKSNLGGIVAGVAAVLLVSRWLQLGAQRSLDLIAAPTLVGMAIGRIGCFLANCCIGTHTAAPWGIHIDGDEHARHPVQLYEAAADMPLVAALLKWVPTAKPGQRIGVAIVSYAGIRFATEFVRADRTAIAGLNPVQWSVLVIGALVGHWLWHRSRLDMRSALKTAQHRSRAFLTMFAQPVTAARIVAAVLCTVSLGASAAFTPLERAVLCSAGVLLACASVLMNRSSSRSRALLPSLGALLFMQAPADSAKPKRELIAGAGFWSGAYTATAGEELISDACGSTTQKTLARRRSSPGWLSFGFRQRLASGKRVSVEAQVLGGKDKLEELTEGPVAAPVANTTSIFTGGASATIEGRADLLRVSMLAGTISKNGRETRGVVGSVTGRTGADRGFFLEGNVTSPAWYATTGDFAYAAFGRVLNREGARVTLGLGAGAYLGVYLPINSFTVDMAVRMPAPTKQLGDIEPNIAVGVKKTFRVR